MNWHEHFDYCEGELFWKDGKAAGCLQPHGYVRVLFRKKHHYAHRIIWEMHNGKIKYGVGIDHIDGNRSNNKLENLRLACQVNNMRNTKRSSANKSGVTGVYWNKNAGKWIAQITINYKTIYLGLYSTVQDAASARKKAEREHGFHENHGREE